MKEYEIIKETVTPGYFIDEVKEDKSVERVFVKTGELKDKWNIFYYIDGKIVDKEFYSYDGINPANDYKIKEGFVDKNTGIKTVDKIDVSKLDIKSIITEIQKGYVLTAKSK